MSRFRRVLHGVVSGYLLLAAVAFYSLASVPIALHYLDTKRFGLWVIMGTLGSYLSLIDAGVNNAAFRLLIDHKDDPNGGSYGSLIKTGWLVSGIQGAIIFVIGLTFAETFARLLAIPADLTPEFIRLVHWQTGYAGLVFFTRMTYLILNAHQRVDLGNYFGICGLAVNFTSQWIFFYLGFGVISLAFGSILAAMVTSTMQAIACSTLKLLPQAGGWGKISWFRFHELFGFGKDVFLISVGSLLITGSQTMIITRLLGVEAAATWGVGLRVFGLLNQIVWKIADMSQSAFAEMIARGEISRLLDRYRSVTMLTCSLAAWAAVSFALCNSLFISIWTHGKIHWPPLNDWLLCPWMFICAVVHCHCALVMVSKQIHFMRYMYFIEGAVYVAVAILTVPFGGLPAMIIGSIICSVLFTCSYLIWRASHFFELPVREVAIDWLRPALRLLLFYVPLAALTWWSFLWTDTLARLIINAALAGSVGAYLFLRFGVPSYFQNELLGRVPAKIVPVFKRVFALS